MGWTVWAGWALFFATPLLLWGLAASLVKTGSGPKVWALVGGGDHRLSLSRLQAFCWTLVIIGSYVAAMAVHPAIRLGSPDDKKKAQERASHSAEELAATQRVVLEKQARLQKTEVDHRAAAARARDIEPAREPKADDPAAKALADAQTALKSRADDLAIARLELGEAAATLARHQEAAKAAQLEYRRFLSVTIPIELLALAGIAIASGVFSSLISAINASDTPLAVTNLNDQRLVQEFPKAAASASVTPDATPGGPYLLIEGRGLGSAGQVRLRGAVARTLFWSPTRIAIDDSGPATAATLVVEAHSGRLHYDLDAKGGLGPPQVQYEWADLLRDDGDPTRYSLMKFQMLAWTVVALFVYVGLFVGNAGPEMDSLPILDSSLVILTGVSQLGYLSGKAVSNMEPPKKG